MPGFIASLFIGFRFHVVSTKHGQGDTFSVVIQQLVYGRDTTFTNELYGSGTMMIT